jgi:hypothetical protein
MSMQEKPGGAVIPIPHNRKGGSFLTAFCAVRLEYNELHYPAARIFPPGNNSNTRPRHKIFRPQ